MSINKSSSNDNANKTDDELDHDQMSEEAGSASESEASKPEASASSSGSDSKKRLFSKELRCMMYGFGDDQNPYTESVDFLEDAVIEFITEVTQKAMEIGKSGRVTVEDIMYIVRKEPRKYARVRDLLSMNEELKKARKAFNEVEYAGV